MYPFSIFLKEHRLENNLLFKHGTGFFISDDGYMMTAAHVLKGCGTIIGADLDGRAFVIGPVLNDDVVDIFLARARDVEKHGYLAASYGRHIRIGTDTMLHAEGFPWRKPPPLFQHYGDEKLSSTQLDDAIYYTSEKMVYASIVSPRETMFNGLGGSPVLTSHGDFGGVLSSFVKNRAGKKFLVF